MKKILVGVSFLLLTVLVTSDGNASDTVNLSYIVSGTQTGINADLTKRHPRAGGFFNLKSERVNIDVYLPDEVSAFMSIDCSNESKQFTRFSLGYDTFNDGRSFNFLDREICESTITKVRDIIYSGQNVRLTFSEIESGVINEVKVQALKMR